MNGRPLGDRDRRGTRYDGDHGDGDLESRVARRGPTRTTGTDSDIDTDDDSEDHE